MDDLSKELEDEKREFEENLDKDSDGRLDREEVKRWAVPSLPGDVEYFEDEADHLIHVADKNEVCGNSSYNTINDHVSIILCHGTSLFWTDLEQRIKCPDFA